MFRFLRRYQKVFFILITIVVVVTFSFFGTNSLRREKTKSDPTYTTLTKEKISQTEIDRMHHFLSYDVTTAHFAKNRHFNQNLLNDGVIQKEILNTQLGYYFACQFLPLLKPHLEHMVELAKLATQENSDDLIRVIDLWKEASPKINVLMQKLVENPQVDQETFLNLVKLFRKQQSCSILQLKKAFQTLHQKYPKAAIDEKIQAEDFALFGFHDLKDWFGAPFLDLSSKYILNVASYAEKKGYEVSIEETKWDLLKNFEANCKELFPLQKVSLGKLFTLQTQALHLSESHLLQIWQKILTFRLYISEGAQGIFLDSLAFQEFLSYAKEKYVVDLFHLPSALRLENFRDLLTFEAYFSSVTPFYQQDDYKSWLELEPTYQTVIEIEKKHPELIEQRYLVEIAEIKYKELEAKIGERELWQWQLKDENWQKIIKEFASIPGLVTATLDNRFIALEAISKFERAHVDYFSRKKMIEANPKIAEEALALLPQEKKVLSFSNQGRWVNLSNIRDAHDFENQIENGLSKHSPFVFCTNQFDYYFVKPLEKSLQKNTVTYEDFLKNGFAERFLMQFLEPYFAKARQACNPTLFINNQNQEKSLDEVADIVGEFVFHDLYKSLEKCAPKDPILEQDPKAFYVKYRFFPYLKKMHALLTSDPLQKAKNTQKSSQEMTLVSHLHDQLQLIQEELEVARDSQPTPLKNSILSSVSKKDNKISLHMDAKGDHIIYFLKDKKAVSQEEVKQNLDQCRNHFIEDAKGILGKKLIDQMIETKCLQAN